MNLEDLDSAVDAVLVEHRYQVLAFIRRLALTVVIPVITLMLVHAWWAGEVVQLWLVAIELIVVTTTTAAAADLRRETVPRTAVLLTVGYGIICAAALVAYGPLLGSGVLQLGWVLTFVFFHGRWLWPTLAMGGLLTSVGIAHHLGWLTPGWAMPNGGIAAWLRMTATATAVASFAGFLSERVYAGMARSFLAETRARQAQAQAEREREASLASLAYAQRFESIGWMAGGAAHDVNNALMVLTAGLSVLRYKADPDDDLLDDMETALGRAGATTKQLVSFARPSDETAGTVSPANVIETLARNLRRLLPPGIQVETQIEARDVVPITAAVLEQVVLNLCLNARDALPGGGTLTLSCEPLDGGIRIVVADNGTGMDDHTKARAFEAFFTTKGTDRGTGLGLAMVRRLVERHHGRVELESSPGTGTRVTIWLPTMGRTTNVDESTAHRQP